MIPALSSVGKKNLCHEFFLFLILIISSTDLFSQSVSINTTRAKPDASAGLDISYPDKGFLIPRIALQGTTSQAPLSGHVAGMIVYNTATQSDVMPGFYINDGTKWKAYSPPQGTVKGNMIYWNGTIWMVIPPGTPGQHLRLNSSGIPEWF